MAVPVLAGHMSEEDESPVVEFLRGHPEIFDQSEYGCEDREIAEVEEAIGRELPADIAELLRMSDGGVIHNGPTTLHLASAEQLVEWGQEGLAEALEIVPFAHDDGNTLFVLDPDGRWGAAGGVFRMIWGRRSVRGYPVQDVTRLADSLLELVGYIAQGREAL